MNRFFPHLSYENPCRLRSRGGPARSLYEVALSGRRWPSNPPGPPLTFVSRSVDGSSASLETSGTSTVSDCRVLSTTVPWKDDSSLAVSDICDEPNESKTQRGLPTVGFGVRGGRSVPRLRVPHSTTFVDDEQCRGTLLHPEVREDDAESGERTSTLRRQSNARSIASKRVFPSLLVVQDTESSSRTSPPLWNEETSGSSPIPDRRRPSIFDSAFVRRWSEVTRTRAFRRPLRRVGGLLRR